MFELVVVQVEPLQGAVVHQHARQGNATRRSNLAIRGVHRLNLTIVVAQDLRQCGGSFRTNGIVAAAQQLNVTQGWCQSFHSRRRNVVVVEKQHLDVVAAFHGHRQLLRAATANRISAPVQIQNGQAGAFQRAFHFETPKDPKERSKKESCRFCNRSILAVCCLYHHGKYVPSYVYKCYVDLN